MWDSQAVSSLPGSADISCAGCIRGRRSTHCAGGAALHRKMRVRMHAHIASTSMAALVALILAATSKAEALPHMIPQMQKMRKDT
jgi:hypothetical protein